MANLANTAFAQMLQNARERKGLSQRDLATKLGVRQSYVSRIETAAVDPRASSLTEFARALDLELVLIPRQVLPAVQALSRQDEPDELMQFEDSVRSHLNRTHKQLQTTISLAGEAKALTLLDKTITDLLPLRYGALPGVQIQTLLEQINTELKHHARSLHMSFEYPLKKERLVTIERLTRNLRAIRNQLAHQTEDRSTPAVPAYRLDGDDDHG